MGIQEEPSSMRGSPRAPGTGAWHTERTANAPDRRAADEGGIMQELWCGNRMD